MPLSSYDVPLSHHFHHLNDVLVDSTIRPILLVFVNGLMLPQSMWTPTLDILRSYFSHLPAPLPVYAVTYDRYGQGESVPKDQQDWKPEPHDMLATASELSTVISILGTECFPLPNLWPKVILVSHSIGVPLVRLHDQHSLPRVYAHLFLDSNIANTDFVSLLPDPEAEHIDDSHLPEDTNVEDVRFMRKRLKGMFHPSVPNSESLDRRELAHLLPHADEPKLVGPNGRPPYLTVVAHDPVAFAAEGFKLNGTPKGLNERYMQPAWDQYYAGLSKLGQPNRTKSLVVAKGAGHFIQRDNPRCVADEIVDLIQKVIEEGKDGEPDKEREARWEDG